MMQHIFSGLLALGLGLTSVISPLLMAPVRTQQKPSQSEELQHLLAQAKQQTQLQRYQEAIAIFLEALELAQQLNKREFEAAALVWLGFNSNNLGQLLQALDYFEKALPILQEVGDYSGEATCRTNIGAVYRSIGQPQTALDYFTQALSIAQEISDRSVETATLTNIGAVYMSLGQPKKALDVFKEALPIWQEVGDRSGEAATLNNIGLIFSNSGQPLQAVSYYNQALLISREEGNRSGEAIALNNMGLLSVNIGELHQALDYYKQALLIQREVGDRSGEAATLNNIGLVYTKSNQPPQALNYYKQALRLWREVGDRSREATTLSNIGGNFWERNQPEQAIDYLQQSVELTLEIRSGLLREQRQPFAKAERGSAIALVSLFMDRNEPERAYEWLNRAATVELANYARLLNAKVANSEAQAVLDQWNQSNQALELQRQRLQKNFSEELAQLFRKKEAEINQEAAIIARRYPETAELFETTLTDIAQLRANIPSGTTVIQPILLADVRNVPNAIAFFILTRDNLRIVKEPVDPKAFSALLEEASEQLNNRFDDAYLSSLAELYKQLIRPIEAEIQATQPEQLSILASGKLRYLPFEALYDEQTDEYLIQKYPISYLTRLSNRSLAENNNRKTTTEKKILAIGNPVPKEPLDLPGAETEVKQIVETFAGSEFRIGSQATLSDFKVQALRFPFLHLATHGCFQKGGCDELGLEENTILFADERFNIADAALLGLQNVELIILSACQTAFKTDSNGEEIAGLAYLFERAGAKATIASLWNAEDATTQEIMVDFYQNLKKGMRKDEALRQAKLSQIDSHPFFWTPFILIGDAR